MLKNSLTIPPRTAIVRCHRLLNHGKDTMNKAVRNLISLIIILVDDILVGHGDPGLIMA